MKTFWLCVEYAASAIPVGLMFACQPFIWVADYAAQRRKR